MTLLEKTDAFWKWFVENRPALERLADCPGERDPQEAAAFVEQGVRLLSPDLRYTFGGRRQFSFSAGGQEPLFYLLPYVVSRKPGSLSDWRFHPFVSGSGGASFDFLIYNTRCSTDQISLALRFDPDSASFQLEFYHPALCELDPPRQMSAFYAMMDLTIGESLSWLFIDGAQPLESPTDNMFPLSQLEARMREALQAMNLPLPNRPDERCVRYGFRPRKSIFPRFDVFEGTTCYTGLLNDYYGGKTEQFDALQAYGARACYLSYPRAPALDAGQARQMRYELENVLQQALGPKGSGLETGVVLGGALGRERCYIDLLLYHEPGFASLTQDALAGYPYFFSLADFCLLSPPAPLLSGPRFN